MSEAAKKIRELERAERKAREDAKAAAVEADVAIRREVDLRRKAENQAKHHLARLKQMRRAVDAAAAAAEAEESEVEGSDESSNDESESDEDQETRRSSAPDGSVSLKNSAASLRSTRVFGMLRDLTPAAAANVLAKVAWRVKCKGELLQAKGMKRAIQKHDISLLFASREYIMENSFSVQVWTRWQHLAHVSMGKVLQLRDTTGYNRVEVSDSDSSDEEPVSVLVRKSMHPDYEYPVGPSFMPVASKKTIERENLALRDGESAKSVTLTSGKSGACMSFRQTALKLIEDAEEQGRLTRSGVVPSGATALEALEYTIYMLQAGDGFGGKGVGDKIVRGGLSLVSQSGNNCSPHDWLDIFGYPGGEELVLINCVMIVRDDRRAAGD